MSAPAEFATLARRFSDSYLDGITILEEIGRGRRSRVYRCAWNGRECALKIHEPEASRRHRRLTGEDIAAFEYGRNLAYFRAPGLARYIAEPLGFVAAGETQALAQELLRGRIYYEYYRERAGQLAESLARDLKRMVDGAHAAGLFDMDLHAMNVMVVETGAGPLPKLFDFNLIPFTVRPQNFLIGWLLKFRILDPRSRDLRRLKHFHDFRPIEKRRTRCAKEI